MKNYFVIINKKNKLPIVEALKLPIYWNKSMAVTRSKMYFETVVKPVPAKNINNAILGLNFNFSHPITNLTYYYLPKDNMYYVEVITGDKEFMRTSFEGKCCRGIMQMLLSDARAQEALITKEKPKKKK